MRLPTSLRARRLRGARCAKGWRGVSKASVDFGQVDELMGGSIDTFLADISRQCEQIHGAIFSAYITYGAETVL